MVHVLLILCTKCLSAVNLAQMLLEEHPFGGNVDNNCCDKNHSLNAVPSFQVATIS